MNRDFLTFYYVRIVVEVQKNFFSEFFVRRYVDAQYTLLSLLLLIINSSCLARFLTQDNEKFKLYWKLPGVALKSLLAQKYAFTKKSTIFTQSLRNLAKIIYTSVGYFDQVSYMIEYKLWIF